MKIRMHDDADLTLAEFEAPEFEVEADPGADAHYSAMQMFATSLGLCTASVLIEYGERFGAGPDGLEVRVRWSYAEEPYRIGEIEMDVAWPELPDNRLDAARRAAEQCTIHNTLLTPPGIVTRVSNG